MEHILFEKTDPQKAGIPFISTGNRNLSFIAHYHKEIEIVYVESGSITVFSGMGEREVTEGNFCILMPYEIHGFKTITPNRLCLAKINPETYMEKTECEKMRISSPVITPDMKIHQKLKTDFASMIKEYTSHEKGYEYAIRLYQSSILLTIYRDMDLYKEDATKDISLLNAVNSFLEENYDKKLELDELAKICHLSKYYFAHKIKDITGMSFVNYLTAFRLEKAIILLKETDTSITDIALKCGFGSLRSFNRCFLSAYKTTPLKYRKKGAVAK